MPIFTFLFAGLIHLFLYAGIQTDLQHNYGKGYEGRHRDK